MDRDGRIRGAGSISTPLELDLLVEWEDSGPVSNSDQASKKRQEGAGALQWCSKASHEPVMRIRIYFWTK